MIEPLKTTKQTDPFYSPSEWEVYDPNKPLPTCDMPPNLGDMMDKINEIIEKLNSIS